MYSLTRSVFLIWLSLGAGLTTQELVSRDALDGRQAMDAAIAERLADWATAERYYGTCQASQIALVSGGSSPATSGPSGDEASLKIRLAELASRPPAVVEIQQHSATGPRADTPPPAPRVPQPSARVPEPRINSVDILLPRSKPVWPESEQDIDRATDGPRSAEFARTPSQAEPSSPYHRVAPPAFPPLSLPDAGRYVDAEELIQRRAARKAEQRSRRIEVRKWLGYSPLRPQVQAFPYTGSDSTRPTVILVVPPR
jgi:hypothetical protein